MRSAPTGDPNISPEQAHRLYRAAKSFYRESPTAANRDALFRALNEIEPGFDMVSKSGPVANMKNRLAPGTAGAQGQPRRRAAKVQPRAVLAPTRKEQTIGGVTFRNGAPTRNA